MHQMDKCSVRVHTIVHTIICEQYICKPRAVHLIIYNAEVFLQKLGTVLSALYNETLQRTWMCLSLIGELELIV
jgi:hypothetical protein